MNRQPDDPGRAANDDSPPFDMDAEPGLRLLKWLIAASIFVAGFALGVAVTLMLTPSHATGTAEGPPEEECTSQVPYCCWVREGPSLPICQTEGEK